jgi:hypothetical protein
LERRQHTLLFLLADGLCGDQMEVVRGAYEVCGAQVPLMGGCAGDDMALQSTRQIHEGRLLTHAVVAAAISSDAPMAIGIAHGWLPLSEPMLVTLSVALTPVSLASVALIAAGARLSRVKVSVADVETFPAMSVWRTRTLLIPSTAAKVLPQLVPLLTEY